MNRASRCLHPASGLARPPRLAWRRVPLLLAFVLFAPAFLASPAFAVFAPSLPGAGLSSPAPPFHPSHGSPATGGPGFTLRLQGAAAPGSSAAASRPGRAPRILALLLILGSLGGAAAFAWRPGLRLFRRFLARKALEAGRKPEALVHLRAVLASRPGHPPAIKDLADLLIELKDYGPTTPPVYESACAAFPNDDRYPKALAYAYSAQGRRDEKAARAYAAMTRVVSHPGPWAFTLGQTLESLGKPREAMEAYHLARRHAFESPELDEALASLYVQLGLHEPEILPVLRRVLDRRMNDPGFLRTFCGAAARARAFDDDARRAAERLIQLEPAAASARVILATSFLQEGDPGAALVHAEVLAASGDATARNQLLLAECFAAAGRATPEARNLYEQALRTHPDARNIQAALARIYAAESRHDAPALALYRAALPAAAAADHDSGFLRAVASLAVAAGDAPLLLDAADRLHDAGAEVPPALALSLARACVEAGRTDASAEAALRRAREAATPGQPFPQPLAEALARIWIAGDRTDTEAIAVYEAACAAEPKPLDVVHQLIKAYSDSQVSERALVLAREFLEKHPGDATLVKLAAGASAALDRLDDAIRDYESVFRQDPGDTESLVQLARLYRRKDLRDEKAMTVYRRAVDVDPENLEIHDTLARAQAAAGDWNGVVQTVKHFLTAAPRRIDAALDLMTALVALPGAAPALRWFLVETLILRSRFAPAVEQIRMLATEPAHHQQALAAYEKILDRQPDDPDALHHRGNLLLRLGRASEARQALERAQRLRPRDEALRKDLLACYEKLIESRDALDLRFKTGRLALELERYDLAIACFQKTDKDERFAADSIRGLARAFLAKGMLDLALHELKKVEVRDDTKGLLYDLGRSYEAAGDPRGAREAYKSIYAVDINYQDVKARMDALIHAVTDPNSPERTAIISSLSEEAKTRYDLIQELGRGAMGIVYKARDNELEEIVALKILPESLEKNPNALRMFREEARNARRLAHPGIVRIHDIGEERGRKYISMEFVDGTDLKQRLIETKRNLPFEETLHYAKQIAEAMAAAHEARIVHRDLKPANVMITKQKRVKVTDFGIAKMIHDETTSAQTKSRTVVGTPLYMSPEQVKGEPVDTRADIYSMGIMFYEMASGRPPFIEGDLAYHHVTTPPAPLPEKVPAEFARIVMKCLEKKPQDRWQSAADVLAELNRIESPEPDVTLA